MKTFIVLIVCLCAFTGVLSISNMDFAVSFNSSQGFLITGGLANDLLGFSVKNAGDINNDGIDDFLIGAFQASALGRSQAGIIYVIYGTNATSGTNIDLNAALSSSVGFKIYGGAASNQIGKTFGYAGDVNNDGIDDIILGTTSAAPSGRPSAGAVYVIYGTNSTTRTDIDLNTPLLPAEGFMISGAGPHDWTGSSVGYAGDVNNDGVDDIIIGVSGFDYSTSFLDPGAAYVIYGVNSTTRANIDLATALTTTQGFKITGAVSNDFLGSYVGRAGDMNGDGIGDVLLGVVNQDPLGRTGAGAVYVIYGKNGTTRTTVDLRNTLSSSDGFKVSGGYNGNNLAVSSDYAGDFNNDGFDDIIIGASAAAPSGRPSGGAAYVIYGTNSTTNLNIDLNTTLATSKGCMISGAGPHDWTGSAVGYAGDVNNDGIDDIMVGVSGYDRTTGMLDTGAVYVIYGTNSTTRAHIDLATALTSTQGVKIIGAATNEFLASSVSYAGDINHDGIADIILGAHQADPSSRTNAGKVYVVTSDCSSIFANCQVCGVTACQSCRSTHRLYATDGQCYASGSCPANTTETSTNCVANVVTPTPSVNSTNSNVTSTTEATSTSPALVPALVGSFGGATGLTVVILVIKFILKKQAASKMVVSISPEVIKAVNVKHTPIPDTSVSMFNKSALTTMP